MEDTDLTWRKASYSSNGGGNCVKAAGQAGRVLVRDTQDPMGPVLRFSPAAWRRFADRLKGGRLLAGFDPSASTATLASETAESGLSRSLSPNEPAMTTTTIPAAFSSLAR